MATVTRVVPKAGTTYTVNSTGAVDVKQHYQVVLQAPLSISELPTAFDGVPAIGAAHPDRSDYYVDHYEISQPKDAAKATLDVTVVYSAKALVTESQGAGEEDIVSQVLEWGWDDSTSQRELIDDVDGTPVVNSAGDLFETVPQVETPAPVFTKVIKMPIRRSFSQYMCKVNAGQLTIGGVTCAPHTLLCTVAEKRNIGDDEYPYTYTVKLRYRSNLVKKEGDGTVSEIGWQVAIADAGMREIDDDNGGLKFITTLSKETGEQVTVSTPELLDGHGHAVTRSADNSATPYNLVFAAYASASFPDWFYSEP